MRFFALVLILQSFAILKGEYIENAVFPLMNEFENIENLQPLKYSKKQFDEISEALKLKEERIRVMSYNLLFDTKDAELNVIDRWPQRSSRVAQMIKLVKPDIICSQELQRNQLNDLMDSLKDEFSFYGEPIKDNDIERDIDGIFYLTNRFKLLSSRVHLIGTPNHNHTLTHCHFLDLHTKKEFIIFNTHLPYSSPEERVLSAHFIVKQVQATTLPVILAGDLNTISQRLDYRGLPFYDGDFVKHMLLKGGLFNSIECSLLGHLGPLSTFTNGPDSNNGIPFVGTGVPGIILDHVFVNKDIKVLLHAIDSACIEGRFPSDHMPVIVDLLVAP